MRGSTPPPNLNVQVNNNSRTHIFLSFFQFGFQLTTSVIINYQVFQNMTTNIENMQGC